MGEKKSSSFATKTIDPNYIHKRDYLSFQERKKETPDIGHHSRSFEASFHLEQRSERIFFLSPIFPLPFPPYGEGRKKEREREREREKSGN